MHFDGYLELSTRCFLDVFGGGTPKILISFVQIAHVALEACGEIQTLSRPTSSFVT